MGYLRGGWRRFQRVIPGNGVSVRLWPGDARELAAQVCDLSEGGVEVELPESEGVPLDTVAPIRLRLGRAGSIEALGRVRHVEGSRLGLLFENLRPQQRQLLRQYVERQAQQGSLVGRLRRLLSGA